MKIDEGKTLQNVEEELYTKYRELKFNLCKKHDEISKKTAEKSNVFNAAQKNMNNTLQEEEKKLSDVAVSLMNERYALLRKIDRYKWFTAFLGIFYLAFTVITAVHFWSVIKEKPILPIAGAVTLGAVVCSIFYKTIKRPAQKRINAINENPEVKNYDNFSIKLYREHKNSIDDYNEEILNLKEDAANLETKILSIENDLFDIKYKDTILFYGSARGYRYSLYIDGLLYDEVKSKRLVVIKLSEGFHSFKLETDEINPIDSSIINTFTFEARQIIVNGNEAQAYAMECDGRRLRQLNKIAFEEVTKQTFNI